MKKVIYKAYYDYEKEEKWLNEMSAKGLALINYSWLRYTFEECEKGEYIYRIEFLEKAPSDASSMEYLKFLKENNIECIATYFNWVYLRKKAAYGPFDIYSDKESKLKHYKRILNFWFLILIFEFTLFISNVYNLFIFNSSESTKLIDKIYSFNSVLLIPILFILILLFKITISLYRKIKKLESEKKIIE